MERFFGDPFANEQGLGLLPIADASDNDFVGVVLLENLKSPRGPALRFSAQNDYGIGVSWGICDAEEVGREIEGGDKAKRCKKQEQTEREKDAAAHKENAEKLLKTKAES